jgi:hypothetical protein
MVSFSSSAFVRLYLDTTFDSAAAQQMVLQAPYQGRGTVTGNALNIVYEQVLAVDHGYRQAHVAVVVVTDGQTQESADILQHAAEQLQDAADVYVIGVGSDVNVTELGIIASRPATEHVVVVESIDMLGDVDMTRKTAENAACIKQTTTSTTTTPPPTTTTTATTMFEPTTSTLARGSLACQLVLSDIVFVLDSSGSLGLDSWHALLNFTAAVIDMLPIGQDNVR